MILKFQCIRLPLSPKGLKGKKKIIATAILSLQSFLKSIISEVKTWCGLLGVLPFNNFIVGAEAPRAKWPWEDKNFKIKACENQALSDPISGALFKQTDPLGFLSRL